MAGKTDDIPGLSLIRKSDVCGLWEVIRICREGGSETTYPWIKDRFKFNFLQEKLFLCMRDGKTIHGKWKLVKKVQEPQKRYSIILDGTYEFRIIDCSEDELVLTDTRNNYLLVRRL